MSSRNESVEAENRLPARLGDHHKTITMATIAKAAGVSQGAISSLLNDRDYGIRVSEKTRERVFKVCREMGYMPNDLRAVVRMYPELGDLCLLVSSDVTDVAGNSFCARIIKGAMQAMTDPSRPIALAQFDPAAPVPEATEDLPHPLRSGTTSKFIMAGQTSRPLLQEIVKRGHPAVVLGDEVTLPGVTSIVPEYSEASRIAIEHLFALGHRQIAILGGPFGTTDPNVIALNRGVREAYQKDGIPIEAQNIIYSDLTFEAGFSSIDVVLDRKPAPTAAFCLSDSLAAGVIARAQARGLKVPQDLTVIGCGDDPIATLVHPALTTVHLPAEEMGEAAVKELNARVKLAEDGLIESKNLTLPVQLVERQSAAPVRQT